MRTKQSFWVTAIAGLATLLTANADAAPRLFAVQDQGKLAFILAESHLATRVELDRYFSEVVMRAARASTSYADEGPPGLYFEPANLTDCNGLDSAAAKREQSTSLLNQALEVHTGRLAIGSIAKSGSKEELRQFISGYPFFLKLIEVKEQVGAMINSPELAKLANKGVPAARIFERIVIAQKGKRAFVETTADFKRAFCAVPAHYQHGVVEAYVERLTKPNVPKIDLQLAERCYLTTLAASHRQACKGDLNKPCDQAPLAYPINGCEALGRWGDEYYRFAIAARNVTWIVHMERLISEGRTFFSLGGAHLPDTTLGPGILSLLRERGYSITLVEDARQLDLILGTASARP
jgi:hypothetical protein